MDMQIDKGKLKLVYLNPATLQPNAANWRVHPAEQSVTLQALLYAQDGVGWAGALLVNLRKVEDGWNENDVPTLVDGHERREIAVKNGEDVVPVLVGRWTPEEERKVLMTLDPVGMMAETDMEKWNALLGELQEEQEAHEEQLEAAVQDVLEDLQEPIATEQVLGEGDLWEVGPHRVLVGNAFNGEDVRRLLDGRRVDLAIVDPPGGVDNPARALNLVWWAERNVCYVVDIEPREVEQAGLHYAQRLIWLSDVALTKGMDYARMHKEVVYAWHDKHFFYGDVGSSTVLRGDWESALRGLVVNSSEKDAVVYVPFCGDGAGVMAAAKEGRAVMGIELSAERAGKVIAELSRVVGQEAHKVGEQPQETPRETPRKWKWEVANG